MSDNGVYQRLAERFPAESHRVKDIGSAKLTYVDGETVISRLNEVLGVDGWSFEVKDIKVLEDEVWAIGRLTVYTQDRTIVREQAGGQIINRKRGTPAQPARPAQPADGERPAIPAVEAKPAVKGEVIELANDIKGAITDCLKKCATLVGVGLYLYDPSERREVEQEMREAKRAPQKPAAPTKAVADAAAVTGAPTPISKERTELVTALENGIAYARSIGLDPALPPVADMSNADLQETLDDLRTQCRLVLAERKKQAAAQQAAENAQQVS